LKATQKLNVNKNGLIPISFGMLLRHCGNIWILAPEIIQADTLVLLGISEVGTKYYLTRK
jgi:hypothetical protein